MPYVLPDGQKVEDSAGAKFYSDHAHDTISFGPYALGRSDESFLSLHGVSWEDPAPTSYSLADEKDRHIQWLDTNAEAIRLKYITPGDGMMMTYREKLEQAEQAASQGQAAIDALTTEEQVAAYPTLSASVGIEAETLWECAQLVLTTYNQWASLSHSIEKIRLAAKKAISDATTVEDVKTAYQAIDWGEL